MTYSAAHHQRSNQDVLPSLLRSPHVFYPYIQPISEADTASKHALMIYWKKQLWYCSNLTMFLCPTCLSVNHCNYFKMCGFGFHALFIGSQTGDSQAHRNKTNVSLATY